MQNNTKLINQHLVLLHTRLIITNKVKKWKYAVGSESIQRPQTAYFFKSHILVQFEIEHLKIQIIIVTIFMRKRGAISIGRTITCLLFPLGIRFYGK